MTEERALRLLERQLQRAPDVVDLARVASLAVRLEPHLLRSLRLKLLHHVDVGTEADLWFSSLVGSRGADYVVLDAGVARVLRSNLAADTAKLDAAYELTTVAHAGAAAPLALEEQLNYLGARRGRGWEADVDEALWPALRTMRKGGDAARELAHWALRALPGVHPEVLQTPNGFALLAAAQAIVGPIVRTMPEVDVPLERVRWALPDAALAEDVEIFVDLTRTGIRFSNDGPGERRLELPDTTPLLVELEWSAGGATRTTLVEARPGRHVDLGAELPEITIRTLGGDEYALERVTGGPGAPRCLVIQAVGLTVGPAGGDREALDAGYEMVRQVATDAGLDCLRIDEVNDFAALAELLLTAEVVVADVTVPDPATLYALGVRHALRPGGTVVVAAEDRAARRPAGLDPIPYRLGDDDVAMILGKAIADARAGVVDSPVYLDEPELTPPAMAEQPPGDLLAGGAVGVFSVELLPARHGTSVLLTYGDSSDPHRVLVDCGPPPVVNDLRERLTEVELELLVLTHPDDDRIGAALRLLKDEDLAIGDIWFNGLPQLPPRGSATL